VITEAIRLGTRKLNVNTEVREAYLQVLRRYFEIAAPPEIVDLITESIAAMRAVAISKLELFAPPEKQKVRLFKQRYYFCT
jgi:tagatose 1,6-diphosphate aldolase GatY/KbaY